MQHELQHVWTSLRMNDDVRAVILTGAGEKAFCSGIDREESIEGYLADPTGQRGAGRVSTPFMFNDPGAFINPKQNDLWKPVIAAVNGMACGGALYMLGESDIIIAAENATFFDPHVSYGMVAGFETVHLLQKLPFGEMPAGVALSIAIFDVTTHATDLARATGQTIKDPDLLKDALIMGQQMIGPELRQPGLFDPEQTAPDGASAEERLQAFAGRRI